MKDSKQTAEAVLKGLATGSTRLQEKASSEKQRLAEHWTAAIFKRMQARYGHKWVSAIDGIELEAVKEWSEGLAGFTPEQIKRGLDGWSEDWPPSLPEFQKECKGEKSGKNEFGLDYVPEYYRAQPIMDNDRLLSSDERDARREGGKAKIRQILNGLKGVK